MQVKSFDEVWQVIGPLATARRYARKVYKLDNMRAIMNALGNPQDSYKSVHIAGTSGKTSTAYYVASMLVAAGKKVGLTVSPHINEVNERTQINMVPMDEGVFCAYFSEFMTLFHQHHLKATYFETMVAFAYWVFAQEKVDHVVIEVGMGGLLDGTNVISRHDKVCVITDLGIDHTLVLGKTIEEITAQKAGIIHPYNEVFMYDQGDAVMDIVREVCEQEQAELHEVWPLAPGQLPSKLPLFQKRNWYLAFVVYRFIADRDKMKMLSQKKLASTTDTLIPARMQILSRQGKTIILDGAHNSQKMDMLTQSVRERLPGKRIVIVLALVHSRDFRVKTRVESLLALGGHVIITSFSVTQDFNHRSVDPAKIAEHCHMLGYDNWEIIADPRAAYRAALKRDEEVVLVTGSFYLISQLKTALFHARHQLVA